MRIGIITLPLQTNYGGLLQAYALQTVLERMGHEMEVISYRYTLPLWKKPLAYAKRVVCKCLVDRKTKVFYERDMERTYPVISRFTEPFVTRYIHKRSVRNFAEIKEGEFDAFVVGSDQIWRPLYVHFKIEDAYLCFARKWKVRRVAYAASFGTDSWEYTLRQTKRCARLLSRFDAVGVREASGVTLCRECFGAAAFHVPDPTLLIGCADYEQLIARGVRIPFPDRCSAMCWTKVRRKPS
ncbi:MAG: polysaccharide pyruvyl transferase family protein [Bacteroides sp.]|nr:polysaccharide pyruvyl transferase family protein [Bacteroides sp.]